MVNYQDGMLRFNTFLFKIEKSFTFRKAFFCFKKFKEKCVYFSLKSIDKELTQ